MESHRKDEVWVGKDLLLFQCLIGVENQTDDLAFVRYIECALHLDEKIEI